MRPQRTKPLRRKRQPGRSGMELGQSSGTELTAQILVRLSPEDADAVRRLAMAQGVTAGLFVRQHVLRALLLSQQRLRDPGDVDRKLDAVLARLARVDGLERQLLAQVVTSVWCTTEVLWLAAGDQALPGKRLPERALIQIEDLVSRLEHAAERPADSHDR